MSKLAQNHYNTHFSHKFILFDKKFFVCVGREVQNSMASFTSIYHVQLDLLQVCKGNFK